MSDIFFAGEYKKSGGNRGVFLAATENLVTGECVIEWNTNLVCEILCNEKLEELAGLLSVEPLLAQLRNPYACPAGRPSVLRGEVYTAYRGDAKKLVELLREDLQDWIELASEVDTRMADGWRANMEVERRKLKKRDK